LHYVNILDANTNVTKVVVGPLLYTKSEQETVTYGPEPMIMVSRHYRTHTRGKPRKERKRKKGKKN
jgi:hypothetical protein